MTVGWKVITYVPFYMVQILKKVTSGFLCSCFFIQCAFILVIGGLSYKYSPLLICVVERDLEAKNNLINNFVTETYQLLLIPCRK